LEVTRQPPSALLLCAQEMSPSACHPVSFSTGKATAHACAARWQQYSSYKRKQYAVTVHVNNFTAMQADASELEQLSMQEDSY
jgi:hypothetical protein